MDQSRSVNALDQVADLLTRQHELTAEIARLTAERDAANARIAELEAAILVRDRAITVANDSVARVDRILESWHKVFPVDDPVIARRMVEDRAHAERDAAIARAERAEAMVVWAVKHHASLYHDEPVKHINYWTDERQRGQGESECDGTDADILRAVAEAMEETESDGK